MLNHLPWLLLGSQPGDSRSASGVSEQGLSAARGLARELPCAAEYLRIADCPAFLFHPHQSTPSSGTPWVWYAPTLNGHPDASHAWMFRRLLERSIAIAG